AGDEQAFLLENINRWRGQLSLAPVDESQLGALTDQRKLAGGDTATLVVLVGGMTDGPMSAPSTASQSAASQASKSPPKDGARTDGMLAAIIPQGEKTWFFKLTGPAEDIAAHRDAFRKFLTSVHFVDGEPRYEPPADWQPQGKSAMRFETFKISAASEPLQ